MSRKDYGYILGLGVSWVKVRVRVRSRIMSWVKVRVRVSG